MSNDIPLVIALRDVSSPAELVERVRSAVDRNDAQLHRHTDIIGTSSGILCAENWMVRCLACGSLVLQTIDLLCGDCALVERAT